MGKDYIRREDREDQEILQALTARGTKVSRRDFLKGAALGAAGVAALGMGAVAGAAETNAAGKDEDWLAKPESAAESDIVETLDCDILVVGAGNSGLFAAGAAAENGAKIPADGYHYLNIANATLDGSSAFCQKNSIGRGLGEAILYLLLLNHISDIYKSTICFPFVCRRV